MIRLPPRSTRTDTLFPYTTLFRSTGEVVCLRNGLEFALRRVAPGVIGTYEAARCTAGLCDQRRATMLRSEEHTSELQSLMRISYAVFCLKKKPYDTR